jgi:5-bromo-4-chloroindolyl phosphate hydrolysis protein
MKKINEYHRLIAEIIEIDLEADSIADSRRILAELNERELILKELKKSVQKDIKGIERDFLAKMHKINMDYAGGKSPGVISRVRRKSKVKEMKKLEKKRDESMEDYQEVRYILDDILLQIEEAKEPLNNYIKNKLFGV